MSPKVIAIYPPENDDATLLDTAYSSASESKKFVPDPVIAVFEGKIQQARTEFDGDSSLASQYSRTPELSRSYAHRASQSAARAYSFTQQLKAYTNNESFDASSINPSIQEMNTFDLTLGIHAAHNKAEGYMTKTKRTENTRNKGEVSQYRLRAEEWYYRAAMLEAAKAEVKKREELSLRGFGCGRF